MARARPYGAAAVVRLVSSSAAVGPEGVEGEEGERKPVFCCVSPLCASW
ncbi:hypothetical protein [Streptomyces altiplanensis]